MTEWTLNQQKAIDTRNKSLLVSAGAGSGKTAVLVERIIRIILEDRVDVRRLVVVTFTKAAAEEMRIRIYKTLKSRLKAQMTEKDRDFINRQINHLNIASISTIHSFCVTTIKKFYHIIGADPHIRIGDESQMAIIRQRAMDMLMENEYEQNDKRFISLLEAYNNKKTDHYFRLLIEKMYTFVMNRPYPKVWSENILNRFKMSIEQFNKSIYYAEYTKSSRIRLKSALNHLNIAWEMSKKINNNTKLVEILTEDINQLNDILLVLDKGYEQYYNSIQNISFSTLRFKCEEIDIKEFVVYHRNKAKDILKKIADSISYNPPQQMLNEISDVAPLMEYLIKMVFDYKKIYSDMKLNKGVMDYNDLEHNCIEILKNKEVVTELKDFYEYIFVDEYQDSNEIQDTIIDAIRRTDNVFFVGDVKQSIYRFRLADPTLFIHKEKEFSDSVSSGFQEKISLNENFRSSQNIIAGINKIFENIMSSYVGEVEYDDQARLYTNDGNPVRKNENIEVMLIDNNADDNGNKDGYEMSKIEIEAHCVADTILQLVEEKIYDPKLNAERKITFGDMVILLRTTKNWSDSYYQVLNNRGIPVFAESQTGYFDTLEISLIVQMLRVIDNRYEDIPLLSVMRSPFFSFTVDEIAQLSLNKGKEYVFDVIRAYICENDDILSSKLTNMLKKIDHWKDQSNFIPIHDFIWKIILESGYHHYIDAMPDGEQRMANVRMLIDRARDFNESNIRGLFNFIKLIEGIHTTKKDLSSAKTAGPMGNTLKIMSIHKSKGLEYPIVFIGAMGKQMNFQDSREGIILHKDLGICPNYVDIQSRRYNPTIFKTIAKEKMNLETLSEEMRVLYVAMTRAKQMLYMVGTGKNLPKKMQETWMNPLDNYMVASAKSYLDWIMPVLLQNGDHNIKIKQIKLSQVVKEAEEKVVNKNKVLEHIHQVESTGKISIDIKDKLEWEYPNSNASTIPSKISISDYVNRENIENLKNIKISTVLEVPKFLNNTEVTGAQKGSVLHFIMQHIDLVEISKNRGVLQREINEQVDSMIEKQILNKEDVQDYFSDKIIKFFTSNLGERMLNASIVYRERPFNMLYNVFMERQKDVLMQGVIDCFFAEGTDYVLIDYKSDYYKDEYQENALIEKYRRQLIIYKEAIENLTQKKVKESYIYLFHRNQIKQINI